MNIKKHKEEFSELGYTIVRKFIAPEVARKLKEISIRNSAFSEHAHEVLDSDGRTSKLTLWYSPGDDVFSRLSCSDKMHNMMSDFLGGDVSFFHAKLMNKEPKVGGKWEWHQDYGYWYNDGFMRADMGSCFVALDPSTTENGSLSVIPGSHSYGRLDHDVVGQQVGADRDRVNIIKTRHGTVLCTMEPGDALFFHANTLHSSAPNMSDYSRLILITCFFRCDNESIQSDLRYRNKNTTLIPNESILDGSQNLGDDMDFSSAESHIFT